MRSCGEGRREVQDRGGEVKTEVSRFILLKKPKEMKYHVQRYMYM